MQHAASGRSRLHWNGQRLDGQLAPTVDINWTGDGECDLNSGFDRVDVYSNHWDETN